MQSFKPFIFDDVFLISKVFYFSLRQFLYRYDFIFGFKFRIVNEYVTISRSIMKSFSVKISVNFVFLNSL